MTTHVPITEPDTFTLDPMILMADTLAYARQQMEEAEQELRKRRPDREHAESLYCAAYINIGRIEEVLRGARNGSSAAVRCPRNATSTPRT